MKQQTSTFRVLVPTVMFGTVRASKGDVVRRELLGVQIRKLVEQGVVEPVVTASQRSRASVL